MSLTSEAPCSSSVLSCHGDHSRISPKFILFYLLNYLNNYYFIHFNFILNILFYFFILSNYSNIFTTCLLLADVSEEEGLEYVTPCGVCSGSGRKRGKDGNEDVRKRS